MNTEILYLIQLKGRLIQQKEDANPIDTLCIENEIETVNSTLETLKNLRDALNLSDKDLEENAKEYAQILPLNELQKEACILDLIAGAKWMRKQIINK